MLIKSVDVERKTNRPQKIEQIILNTTYKRSVFYD